MNAILRFAVVLLAGASLTACVAPGSAVRSVAVRGALSSSDGRPLANAHTEIILPAAYGLGGLDMASAPEAFGNKDERFTLRTDASGTFYLDLGARVVHVSCWILPPVGCYPKRAPAPFIFLRTEAARDEFYAIQTGDGEYRIFAPDGRVLEREDARLRRLEAHSEPGKEGTADTVGVVNIEISLD